MSDLNVNNYCFIVGTSRGSLLYTSDKPNKISISKNETVSDITALTFGRKQSELVIGYKDGNAAIYDKTNNAFIKNISKLNGEGPVIGIGVAKNSFILGKSDGIINIWSEKDKDFFSINLDEKSTLDSMVYNKNREYIIGTGGEFNDFKLWNIETKQCIFKAKSMGHDELQLPIPTSVRGITFVPENEHLSICATKEGHVLTYDERVQRRPVVKFLEKKASYTCVTSAHRESQVVVGTTKGYMQVLDMKTGKCLRTFTSFSGSVTDIVCDPLQPIVASTSLDRHLRVHNLETKEPLYKMYMKQNLKKLLVFPIIKDEPIQDDPTQDVEYEEIFKNMEEISSSRKSRKSTKLDEEYEELFKNMEVIKDRNAKVEHNKTQKTCKVVTKRKSLSKVQKSKKTKIK